MPPEVPYCHPLLTPLAHFSAPAYLDSHKYCRGNKRMKFPGRKLIPLLVFILTSLSILRLLRFTITASPSSPISAFLLPLQQNCSTASPTCNLVPSQSPGTSKSPPKTSANATALTKKEFKLLSDLITNKAPCNLLIFGLEPQYLELSEINAGGITIFLEDDADKISAIKRKSNRTQIYKVEYQRPAKDAYKLLKHARKNPACAPRSRLLQASKCKLALTYLPQEVYKHKWDVVVVDGPIGNTPEAPGRMAAIYTASIIARAENITDVVVHDVDRTIEKWFSWEFLCEDNLVSSKGKLWNFRIRGRSNSTRFCPAKTIQIE
ncbi:hypothetical protein ACOSP7_000094 [Xanthoceras sorbifolium]|uniref:Polysaccharide biosynthesis domain-containing protein n=1 Tax=Xanthoceras sorbifolium TaxID=99658 RepID=A0ABQ8IPP8_9ROSI|nr:hypothetical protein JRO89_XS01G0400900 [Xanthoceras sorbifolium]